MEEYHNPVMLQECLDALQLKPDGVYVDATYGGGGHSKEILKALGENGTLVAFDQDADSLGNVVDDKRLIFVPNNFRYMKKYLRLNGFRQIDGILADLGVSSHQINVPERGFSFRFEADLDMRMDQQGKVTAMDVINDYSETQLVQIFSEYGEVRNSKTLAKAINLARATRRVSSVKQFVQILEPLARGNKNRYFAQVFQAIRIEVNDEMGALKDFLQQTLEVLNENGRLVVMSYHSLEDRLVKNFIKKGNFGTDFIKDDFGNIYRPYKPINKKAIEATAEEIKINPRARSAKLRIASKK